MAKERDIYTCGACGWRGHEVEAGGIYYCPNRFCRTCGAFGERAKAGYHDQEGNQTGEQIVKMREELKKEILAVIQKGGGRRGERMRLKALLWCRHWIEDQFDAIVAIPFELVAAETTEKKT